MCLAGKNSELLVHVGQQAEEIHQVFFCSNTVMFAAHDHYRAGDFRRIDYRQVCTHVEIGSGRDGVAVLKFGLCQGFRDDLFRCAGLVTREDGFEEGAVDRARIM